MALNIPLPKEICETPGAPGHEDRVRRLVIREIASLVDEFHTDNLGNVIGLRKGKTNKKVMVAAHMDEISFMISHIDEDGFARFQTLGGFDPKTLTAQRVIAHGKEDVMGVMGSKPIHIMDPEERTKPAKLKDYYIDFGLPVEKVKSLLSVGDVVTRERSLIEMGDCINSKSLDNRISVFILIEALRRLKNPAFDTYAVFSVQEEVGLRGAQVAAHSINPDFGFGLDTTIAFDLPGADDHEMVTQLGKGVAIKIMDSSVISDTRMVKFMRGTAETHGIVWQHEILPAGGTDTAAIQRGGKFGAVSGCISIPTRHIHSVIEMVHKDDVEGGVLLLGHCLEDIGGFDFNWK